MMLAFIDVLAVQEIARFEQAPVSQTRRCLFSTLSRNPFI
jgi:hypothetical protein